MFNRKKKNIIATVDEQAVIHELNTQNAWMVYEYRTENNVLNINLEKAGVNISTFNKLFYIQNQSSTSLTDLKLLNN